MISPRNLMTYYLKVTILLFILKIFKNWWLNSTNISTVFRLLYRKKSLQKNRALKYNLQTYRVALLPNPKTKKYDTDRKAAQCDPKLPVKYGNLSSLDLFKSEIKNWYWKDFPCNIYWIFVDGVSFINWTKGNCQKVYLSIDNYSGWVQNLSGECLLWGFSLDEASTSISEEAFRRLLPGWSLK